MESLKEIAKNLKHISEEAAKWQEVKKEVFKPLVKDTKYISSIRKWVVEDFERLDNSIKSKFTYKDFFLMIVIFLYSPQAIAEESLSNGVRNELRKELGTHPTRISHSLSKVRNWIYIYRDFEESLTYLYSEILNRLKEYE